MKSYARNAFAARGRTCVFPGDAPERSKERLSRRLRLLSEGGRGVR